MYIPPVKSESQVQGCILRRAVAYVSSIWRWQSDKDVDNYFTFREMRTWRIPAHVITGDFCCFSQCALHGVHCLCSHMCVVQMRWAYAMHIRELFVSSTSGIVLNKA